MFVTIPAFFFRDSWWRRTPFSTEELTVFGEEPQNQAAAHIGPEEACLHRSSGIECEGLEAEAGEGAKDGEEDEVGNRVEFGCEFGSSSV